MSKFVVAEEGHLVNVIPPVDVTGGVSGDRFSMANYSHCSLVLQMGVSAAAVTSITLNECDAASGGTANAIGFSYYAEETAAGDTLGARTTVAATGITAPSANDNIMYVIELDARELSDGFPWVELVIANGVNSVIASALAILSGARHGSPQSATVLA